MKPSDREDSLYTKGKVNQIAHQERILFEFMKRYVPSAASVADIGCGTGEISLFIVQMGYQVDGFDFSQVAISKATEKGVHAQFADFDEVGIPLSDGTMDCIYAGDVVEHVFDPLYLFKEFERVLKPGGIVLASLPHDANLSNIKSALFARSFQESLYKDLGACKHHSFISIDLVRLFAERANLSLYKMVLIGYPNFLNRNKNVERSYSTWQVPFWIKYLSHQICIFLRKPTDS